MRHVQKHGHVREHDRPFARREKQVLISMAQRLPRRIDSDHLTALGVITMIGAGAVLASMTENTIALNRSGPLPREQERRWVEGDGASTQ